MKKSITFALAALTASFAFSNTIEWALENVDGLSKVVGNQGYEVALLNTAWYSVDEKTGVATVNSGATVNGENDYSNYEDGYAYGWWKDDLESDPDDSDTAATYYLAIFDTASSTYYALADKKVQPTTPYAISTADMDQSGLYGEKEFYYIASDVMDAKSFKVVPEPATAALALAGIALLFRRRKA